ncbi:hypothetical protein PUN28_002513 [Cardiocondyla obscurior]|uniref:C2H2-type domain-containing protein n=1 Tax=Cardiocondyla obscurior TaxID=286306 RepID=A0AAW2GUS6_9HYME
MQTDRQCKFCKRAMYVSNATIARNHVRNHKTYRKEESMRNREIDLKI